MSDSEQPDRVDAVSAVRPLLREPDSVADAVDLDLRLDALADWLKERRNYVRAWLLDTALDRHAEDGAAPTWRLDGTTVSLTDPKPKPYVADSDAFARWYATRSGADVDAAELTPGAMTPLDDDVAVFAHVTVSNAALAAFAEAIEADRSRDALADAAEALAPHVTVERQVVIPTDLLDRLVETADVVIASTDDGHVAIDAASGEVVPGVKVRPPGQPTIQVRPSQATRGTVRRELDEALHPPSTRRPDLD